MAIATIPAFLLFVAIVITLYFTMVQDARLDISERGRFTAAALAESSRYGLISGNTTVLDRALKGVLDAEPTIAAIVVEDAERHRVTMVGNDRLPAIIGPFEAPMHAEVPDVDLFDKGTEAHLAESTAPAPRFNTGAVAGYVLVYTQAEPLLVARRQRLLFATALVACATLLSGIAGLLLAQWLRAPLSAVMGALRQIRQGTYDIALPTTAPGDIGELQRAVVEMAKAMSTTQQDLERLVEKRTAELQSAVAALEQAHAEKRRLIAHGNEIVEEERRRVAGEIHDNLNASLVAVKLESMRIRNLAARLPNTTNGERAQQEITDIAARITTMAGQVYDAARNIVKSLRPEVIDTLGLQQAIEDLVRHYDELHPECTFELITHQALPQLRGPITMSVYRLIQEALVNIVKHASAHRATVVLDPQPTSNVLEVLITDDGIGFNPEARVSTASIGLIGMRERVAAAGGQIAIESSSAGTRIKITLPLNMTTAGAEQLGSPARPRSETP
ncbi:MAG: ATP-binding protein [Candidatus Methylophosphatis roskildensis]